MTSVWATRPDIAPGGYPRGDEIEAMLDRIQFLNSPPMFQGRQTSGAQSIANGTFVALTFDVEDYDNYGGHSTSTNTERYTAVVAGVYMLCGSHSFAASASTTTQRGSSWYKNGSQIEGSQVLHAVNSNTTWQFPTKTILTTLAVGDYIELRAFQNTGGALNTDVSFPSVQSMMTLRWVAEV